MQMQSRTRCRPGDDAVFVGHNAGENVGRFLRVIRPYSQGEIIDGKLWDFDGHARWVVEVLGEPLILYRDRDSTPAGRASIAVALDSDLQPLRRSSEPHMARAARRYDQPVFRRSAKVYQFKAAQ